MLIVIIRKNYKPFITVIDDNIYHNHEDVFFSTFRSKFNKLIGLNDNLLKVVAHVITKNIYPKIS